MARKPKAFGTGKPKKMLLGGYTSLRDMFDGGGPGASSTTSRSTSTSGSGGGGADSGQAGIGYSGFSLRGLTSTDPANVARNQAAAARYAAMDAARPPRSDTAEGMNRTALGGMNRPPPANSASRAIRNPNGRNFTANAPEAMQQNAEFQDAVNAVAPKLKGRKRGSAPMPERTSSAAPAPIARTYMAPPANYRPGVDPEWEYYQPAPTVTLAKGGKVKPKATAKAKPKPKAAAKAKPKPAVKAKPKVTTKAKPKAKPMKKRG